MEMTLRTLSNEELAELYVARQARLEKLHALLNGRPADAETRFARRLIAHAQYTTWLDLESLKAHETLAVAH